MKEIRTEQYINSEIVKVSFEVSDDDWCLIQQSEPWKSIQNFLEVPQSIKSQMSLKEKIDLLERIGSRKKRGLKDRVNKYK